MLPSIDVFVVGRRRHVVLDELAAFEHGEVRDAVRPLVHDHQVATGRAALAPRPRPAFERLGVERLEQQGAVDVDVAHLARVDELGRGPTTGVPVAVGVAAAGTSAAAALAPAPATAAPAALLRRAVGTLGRRASGVGRGLGRRRRAPVADLGRPPAAAGRSRPASSRACSAMSSSVRPRSALAAVQSSLPSSVSSSSSRSSSTKGLVRRLGRHCSRRRTAFAPVPGFLRPRPPRDPRRRFLRAGAWPIGTFVAAGRSRFRRDQAVTPPSPVRPQP